MSGLVDQRQSDGAIQMPWYSFSEEAQKFLHDVSRAGWVRPFDWPKWLSTKRGQHLLGDTTAIAEATADELSQILTALIRQDRFAEGTLASAYESGILAAVARRAEALSADLDRDDAVGPWSRRPWGRPWSGDRDVVGAAAAITEIGLARGMCYGPCPVYSVSLHRDGRAVFMGEHFVDLLGEHLARIEPTDFDALAVVHLRFGNLRKQYEVDYTDAQTTTTWVVRSRRRKTVQDYGGAGPHRLRQVEGLVDDAAAELTWQRADRE